MQCALCEEKKCTSGQNCTGKPTREIMLRYDGQTREILEAAAKVEGRYYLQLTRLEESVKLAQELGCKKIGVAFCIGLAEEAKVIVQYLQKFFEVNSVCCKVCGIAKSELNLEQIKPDCFEPICNPATQAQILNDAGTELNFIVGLCVGHDMIFTRYSQAYVSTLIAKDRVLAHNPIGAVYSGYLRKNRLGLK